jgi:hypothetical protein
VNQHAPRPRRSLAAALGERARAVTQDVIASVERDPLRAAAALVAFTTLAVIVGVVMAPWLVDLSTFGFHDWDVQAAHRYLVRLSLLRYHEFPAWNPFACGGFPAWGYVEGDTAVVSPFLPAYLWLPLSVAIRVEVLGMAAIGAAGAYLVASRFTESHAARALVAALWAVNGRWALQAAAGHTWHLAYAWTPLCLYFFERARGPRRRVADLAAAGACFAMLVYAGGIYPLPHTALGLGIYALVLATLERSPRPLATLAAVGLVAVGLAAPKLLPLLDGFGKAPRLIESKETMDLGALYAMLTSRDQGFYARPARVSPYGWHEWGIYIGLPGLGLLALGFVFVEGRRESALKALAALFVLLGFGAFHPDAPWSWLHEHGPVFRSQHVPSRFLYPAVLALALVAAAGLGRAITRQRARLPWLDLAATIVVFFIGLDVAHVAQRPMAAAMWMVPPDAIPADRAFHFEREPPFQYKKRDWAGPMYLAMLGNTGVLNCYGTPPFDRKGARATSDPRYQGEVHVEGQGTARIAAWSPNRVIIDVEGAAPGSLLVYNMNYDEGWRADTGPVVPFENAVATPLTAGSARVVFWYRPPFLGAGLLLGAATAALLVALRRREARASGEVHA